MSITKMRLSNKDICKVTFTLPSYLAETAYVHSSNPDLLFS